MHPHRYKGKFRPIKDLEEPEKEYRYSSILSLTAVLDEGGWSMQLPGRFNPGTRPATHCTGEWVGPGPVWTGEKISRYHRDSIPELSSQ
jgi:hypothetical protein